ncbi:hypothetical protein CASFOL_017384 [Castilleja foliolosa]|uniref:Secreted protein n=1 Tax=Castilleja foliolosa TaxID=1961234 RepID=A0ABD3DBV3_9LAMI
MHTPRRNKGTHNLLIGVLYITFWAHTYANKLLLLLRALFDAGNGRCKYNVHIHFQPSFAALRGLNFDAPYSRCKHNVYIHFQPSFDVLRELIFDVMYILAFNNHDH